MKHILFVGDLNEYGRSYQRYQTLTDLGYEVHGLSQVKIPWRAGKDKRSLIEKISWKIRLPADLTLVNKNIRSEVRHNNFNAVWIEKGNFVRPSTLRYIKACLPSVKLVSCSEDDMYAWHSRSLYYTWGLKYYDIVFTTKTYNLTELKELGAKKTVLFLDSYNEKFHRSMMLSQKEEEKFCCDVGFLGSFEEDRAQQMLYLAEHGVQIVVWGNDWGSWVHKHQNLIIKNEMLYGEDYSKAINATKINLNFLRKANRDEVTSRSVEIPACGGFMVAERTKRHLEFFEEGKEAIFFSSQEELLKLVKKYLIDEEGRKTIATAGYARCLKSGYNMKTQLKKMLEITLV